jgi:hypothetical protein
MKQCDGIKTLAIATSRAFPSVPSETTSKVIILPDVEKNYTWQTWRSYTCHSIFRGCVTRITVYVRITWLGVHVEHPLFNSQAVWRMNKVKLCKTCLRTEIVWICFSIKTSNAWLSCAWAPPFVTMVTSPNIFEVVFPQERLEELRMSSLDHPGYSVYDSCLPEETTGGRGQLLRLWNIWEGGIHQSHVLKKLWKIIIPFVSMFVFHSGIVPSLWPKIT